jgi:hypothetical protein
VLFAFSEDRAHCPEEQSLTGVELIDLGINHMLAANQVVLPTASFESAQAKGVSIATDQDDGFKRVA